MVSSWLPPVTVSAAVIVSVLLPAEDKVTLSVPAPRLIVPLAMAVRERSRCRRRCRR